MNQAALRHERFHGVEPPATVWDLLRAEDRQRSSQPGSMHTLVCKSRPWSSTHQGFISVQCRMLSQGFKVLNLRGSTSLYSLMSGNCMTIPVIGAFLFAALVVVDLGKGLQILTTINPRSHRLVLRSSQYEDSCYAIDSDSDA